MEDLSSKENTQVDFIKELSDKITKKNPSGKH